jgi:hypothetical protein
MPSLETIDVLNRLLAILCRSFPQYLQYAHPYIPPGNERLEETIENIVTDQDTLIERISRLIEETGSPADRGEFPMLFTDAHDLGIGFLVDRAIDYGRQDIEQLQACAESLNLAPAAKSLAEEALGMTKAHVESLEEAAGPQSSASPMSSQR